VGESIEVLIGRAAFERGLVSSTQLEECGCDSSRLVDRGYLTPRQAAQLRADLSGSDAPTLRAPPAPPSAPPEGVGRRFGKYHIVGELGRGGMGSVHKAWDPSLNRWVALKVLLSLGGEEEIARFRREAQTAATLSHPGIVGVYEIGMDGERSFIAMEFVQGRTLAGERPSLSRACEILIDVARAVDHAHRRGIIHRDLKPQNIMLDSADKVRVMDFGLAKPLRGRSQVTIEGTVIGTPSYMSPEQADGRIAQIDHRSDVYSLGAVLYELLTGRPPFRGASVIETLTQVVEKRALPPSKFNRSIPRALEAIVLKALDKDKTRRYASAEAFARDLERFRKGQAVDARRPRRPSLGWAAFAVVPVALVVFLLVRPSAEEPVSPTVPKPAAKAAPAPPKRNPRAEAQPSFDAGQRLYDAARLDLYKPGADLSKMRDAMEQAAAQFTRAIEIHPAYPEAFLGRGQARALQNRPDEAILDFTHAIVALPVYPAALLARGQIHLERYMAYMESSGWRREEIPPAAREWRSRAIEDLAKARDGGLKGGDFEFCLASLAVAEAQPQKAITILSKLIDGPEKREEHYRLRGEAQFLLAEGASAEDQSDLLKRSLADFAEAIRLRPNYHQAYRRRGGLQFLVGRTDECLADLQSGLRMNPSDSTALSDLGTYFQRTNRADMALDYYARALQADPDNFRALNNRSSLWMSRKNYAAAKEDIERALKISPDHVAGNFNLATVRDAMGQTEEAIRLLTTILARQATFARGYYTRAVFRYKLGRWAEALDDLEKASGIDPKEYQASCRPYIEDCRKRLGRP